MRITSSLRPLDARALLDMVSLQLNWLDRQIATLRHATQWEEKPFVSRRTFKSLRGVWAGVVVSDHDFEAARITLPEDLS